MEQLAIQLFENKKIRVVWDSEAEKYYFSIVDVVQILTESTDGRKYWNKLKQRLKAEGNESVTNCHQLKLPASDGKRQIGHSIVSPEKASDYLLPTEEAETKVLPETE